MPGKPLSFRRGCGRNQQLLDEVKVHVRRDNKLRARFAVIDVSPPTNVQENKRYRSTILRWADTRSRQKAIVEKSGHDIVWWIDSFGWQFNPDIRGKEVDPFICYDFQAKGLRRTMRRLLEFRLPCVWEKSRKLGASWLLVYLMAQQSAFVSRQKFLVLSHNEDAVNRPDDPDSLFWKVRFVFEMLPEWMRPGMRKLVKSFYFPRTRSSITSSATTKKAGVGGRGIVICDEFSKHPNAYDILGQTVDTGPQLFVGTHYGIGGAFYDLTVRPDMFKEVFHWTHHPDRQRGLYKSNPVLPQGYEILDKDYEYGHQCSCCSRSIGDFPLGEHTECCEEKGVSREYQFITDGQPDGGFAPGIRSPYYDHECAKRNNPRDVAMHLDINPKGSQSSFFNGMILRRYVTEICRPPIWRGDIKVDHESAKPVRLYEVPDGPIKLWVSPRSENELPVGKYAGGGDISVGTGATPSVFSAGDAMTCKKVLEYVRSDYYPDKFALYVVALCWLMKDFDGKPALLAWESNGPGLVFGKEVIQHGYKNIYWRVSDPLVPGIKKKAENAGVYMTPKMKRLTLDSYKIAIQSYELANYSEGAIGECSMYRYGKSRDTVEHPLEASDDPEVSRSNHGDIVIGDAIMWMMLQRLGAGKELRRKEAEKPPEKGSFLYRRMMRQQKERVIY